MGSVEQFFGTLEKADKELLQSAYSDPAERRAILPTGFFALDDILGGGLKAGTYNELYGAESVGKSTLALYLAKQCQEIWGQPVAYFDYEGTWSSDRAQDIGVSLAKDMFTLWQFPTQEAGYNVLNLALKEKVYGLVVIDSLSGMPVTFETENKMEQQSVGYQARNNSRAFRILTASLGDTIVILINQVRENMSPYGSPFSTSGGRAIKHYDHLRVELKKEPVKGETNEFDGEKMEYKKTDKKRIGHYINCHLTKNKLGAPENSCRLYYDYAAGHVDYVYDVIYYLVMNEVIQKSGTHNYLRPDGKKSVGRKSLMKDVAKDFDWYHDLALKVRNGDDLGIELGA